MDKFKFINIDEIIVHAASDTTVYGCIPEACILALSKDVNVRLIHNDNQYMISPEAIRASVEEAK